MKGGAIDVTCDVLVVGGGPAGAAAAVMLSRWGHEVVVLDRPTVRPPLAESLPPSCRRLMEEIGVLPAVATAGFVEATGNTVWWGGDERRVEPFPAGATGWQVDRARFDEVLRAHAIAGGVRWYRPAMARALETVEGVVVCTAELGGTERVIRARWAIDASGRSGLVARHQRTAAGTAWRTMALAAEWRRPGGWGLPDESHTLVESAANGWGWSVPVDRDRRYFTVMFNPASEPPVGGAIATDYHRRFGQLPALAAIAHGGACIGAPFACDASTYEIGDPVHGQVLAVGDAASFLDPLSSFGVKKALASGWMGAIAIHTALVTPEAQRAALALFRRREAEYVRAARGPLGALSRDAVPGAAAGFWTARAALEADDAHADLVATLRQHPGVHRAFEELRRREPAVLRRGNPVRVAAPLVRDHLVVDEPHLVLDGIEAPVRYLRNIDLVALADLAGVGTEMGALCAAYEQQHGVLPLPDLIGAISTLLAHDVLAFA